MANKTSVIGIHVGLKRLPKKSTTLQATFTRSTRESMQEIIENYKELIAVLRGATPQILHDIMAPVFDLSQTYCPIKTGRLRSSGKLETRESDTRVRVMINYGDGGAVPYAAVVHERTELYHNPPTRAKFLQSAMEESLGDIKAEVIEAYRSIIEGSGGRMK